MDARRKEIVINEAYDYIRENWIYTESFLNKIEKQSVSISEDDPDLKAETQSKLIEMKKIFLEINNDRPSLFNLKRISLFAPRKVKELPQDMLFEIFSKLDFESKRTSALVCKKWNTWFNQQQIEKKYLFPSKSGGLVIDARNKSPNTITILLQGMKKEFKEDIVAEIVNNVSLDCNEMRKNLSKKQDEAISSYYASLVPLFFLFLLGKYFESDKVVYGIGTFILGIPLLMLMGKNELNRLKTEPKRVEEEVKCYLNLKH